MPSFHLEVKNTVNIIKTGGLVLFPSDTSWCIGCDPKNPKAVSKLLNLVKTEHGKATCFVADDRMLQIYVKAIPFAAKSIIEVADTPTTIIYDEPKNMAENLIRNDNSIAIRIPDDEFCYQLTRRLNGAVATTKAKINDTSIPKSFKEIVPAILKDVDYIVNLQKEKIFTKQEAIIKVKTNGIVKVIRK